MHLLHRYALTGGVKIGQPFIAADFYPVPSERYVTIHHVSKFESRRYEYFAEVLDIIRPALSKYNIKVIQVGTSDEPPIQGADTDLRGKTTINQMAYVIKGSMLHIGVDSFPVHLAGWFGIPVVGMYPNMLPSQSGPVWGDSKKQILLAPDFKNKKPSYSANEADKMVNKILPEDIANAVLSLLGSKQKAPLTTLHIGSSFKSSIIDIVPTRPDYQVQEKLPKEAVYTIRLDISANTRETLTDAARHINHHDAKVFMRMGGKVEAEFAKYLSVVGKVEGISFEVTDETEESDLELIKRACGKIQFYSKNPEKLKIFQAKFFDYLIFPMPKIEEENLARAKKLLDETPKDTKIRFSSSYQIFKSGKRYTSVFDIQREIENNDSFDSPEQGVMFDSIYLFHNGEKTN